MLLCYRKVKCGCGFSLLRQPSHEEKTAAGRTECVLKILFYFHLCIRGVGLPYLNALLVQEVAEVKNQRNGGGSEVKHGRLKITALWNSDTRVDISEELAATMDSAFLLPDNRGCTFD
jgi:hypothetical protein